MTGPSSPPVNQPQPRPAAPAPPVRAGLTFVGVKDWFLKFDAVRQVANADFWEHASLLRINFAVSAMMSTILGWYHSTTVGFSQTIVKGKDLKAGAVTYVGFINNNRTELINGKKDELIYGWKWTIVSGKKNRMGAGNQQIYAIRRAEFRNKCTEYWNLRKEAAQQVKEEIATYNRVHNDVQEEIKKCQMEFDKATVEVDNAKIRADKITSRIESLLREATRASEHVTADLKIIADSAIAFEASANWDGDLGSQLKLHSALHEFAASISKLG
jgi:hypothetical protein